MKKDEKKKKNKKENKNSKVAKYVTGKIFQRIHGIAFRVRTGPVRFSSGFHQYVRSSDGL